MIQIITKGNSQGYLASYVLRSLFPNKEVSVIIDDTYSLSKEGFEYDPEADVIIMLGYAYSKNQETMARTLLENKANPFTLVLHVSSYGEQMDIGDIVSLVDEVRSPVAVLVDYIMQNQGDSFVGRLLPLSDNVDIVSDYVAIGDDYHRHDFSLKRQMDAVDFNDLLLHYGVWLSEEIGICSIESVALDYKTEIQAIRDTRERYLARRLRTADISFVGNYIVGILYAERYQNEIAHWIISQYAKIGSNKVIVLIGDRTAKDDMFRVRTLGVNAGEVANYLNGGNGKDLVGTVFLGDASKHTIDVAKKMLAELP